MSDGNIQMFIWLTRERKHAENAFFVYYDKIADGYGHGRKGARKVVIGQYYKFIITVIYTNALIVRHCLTSLVTARLVS